MLVAIGVAGISGTGCGPEDDTDAGRNDDRAGTVAPGVHETASAISSGVRRIPYGGAEWLANPYCSQLNNQPLDIVDGFLHSFVAITAPFRTYGQFSAAYANFDSRACVIDLEWRYFTSAIQPLASPMGTETLALTTSSTMVVSYLVPPSSKLSVLDSPIVGSCFGDVNDIPPAGMARISVHLNPGMTIEVQAPYQAGIVLSPMPFNGFFDKTDGTTVPWAVRAGDARAGKRFQSLGTAWAIAVPCLPSDIKP